MFIIIIDISALCALIKNESIGNSDLNNHKSGTISTQPFPHPSPSLPLLLLCNQVYAYKNSNELHKLKCVIKILMQRIFIRSCALHTSIKLCIILYLYTVLFCFHLAHLVISFDMLTLFSCVSFHPPHPPLLFLFNLLYQENVNWKFETREN